ncbi:carbon monoxide dehydrogenase subunit G [Streptomyces sp. P3]|uniref:SRPBCC domain-containing protein n=1 Tax=Streptomyces sp. P3 TaxID=2135430 RepID=UPI000D1B87C0|nr:SRPBCC domain-containing protein [Streptomyces sp. P3]AVV41451.1 carbon monoxide dehydrogenase subunit G [Streptomyces sp. P3]
MEQEVFVPVPAERLRAALADPAQVARAVPGLQQDAGTEPVAGRLKVRIGSHTITYRGAARVSPRENGGYAVEGGGTEVRGSGTVKLSLALYLREADAGTTLRFEGTASADGRVAELPAEAVESAVARLLNRFAGNLGASAAPDEQPGAGTSEGTTDPAVTGRHADHRDADHRDGVHDGRNADASDADASDADASDASDASDVDTSDVPDGAGLDAAEQEAAAQDAAAREAGAPDDVNDPNAADDVDEPVVPAAAFETAAPPSELDDLTGPAQPPAEAAHARRTMIGRSAEEVDHAPPRGRYAPVPAPQTVMPNSALRWAAPAAALVVASAIVVGRALRRRG